MKHLAALLLLALATRAGALPITYGFSGTWDSNGVEDEFSIPFPIDFAIGDSFSGSFTYDTDLNVDTNPSTELGTYLAVQRVTFLTGGAQFDVTTSPIFDINISNDRPSLFTFDGFTVRASGFESPVPVLPGQTWTLNPILRSTDITLFDSDALQEDLGEISDYDFRHDFLFVFLDDQGNSNFANGTIETLTRLPTPVPEPGTLWLLVTGMGLAFATMRRLQLQRADTA